MDGSGEENATTESVKLIENAYMYKVEGRYPEDCTDNQKRVIRRKASQFEVFDGELVYKYISYSNHAAEDIV